MSHRPVIQPAPNYTNAFLWSFGVLLFFVFAAIAAIVGLVGSVLTALGADRMILEIARVRRR